MQTSADGCVEAADPAVQWPVWDWGQNWPWDDELKRDFNETFRAVDRILLSRKNSSTSIQRRSGRGESLFRSVAGGPRLTLVRSTS